MAHRVCTNCGQKYSIEHAAKWGTHKASDGMGTRALCTALVPAPNAPRAAVRQPDGTVRYDEPLQLCRGELAYNGGATTVDPTTDVIPIEVRL